MHSLVRNEKTTKKRTNDNLLVRFISSLITNIIYENNLHHFV